MPAAIPRSQLVVRAAPTSAGPPPPEPGLLETIGAQSRVSQDEWSEAIRGRRAEAYRSLAAALEDAGIPRERLRRETRWYEAPSWLGGEVLDNSRVWRAVEQAREADPAAFAELPATREEFEQNVLTRNGGRARDQATVARSSGLTGLAGALVGGAAADMADSDAGPLQFMIGAGGKSVVSAALREGFFAATEEAVKQPERIKNRRELGEETSWGQIATDIGGTFLFGGALGGGGFAVGKYAPEANRVLRERVTANLDRLPAPLRQRWEAKLMAELDPLDDPLLYSDVFEALVPRESMSELEQAAVVVGRREGRAQAANPFVGDGAGTAMHDALLAETAARALEANPFPAPLPAPAAAPAAAAPTGFAPAAVPRPVTATARAGPASPLAEQRFMARVRGAESGGDDAARNPRSSATGRYQFTDSTWLAYYKRRFGSGGLSDAQILAKRGDGQLQDTLMSDLTAENAAGLRAIGAPVTEGNLYLAHFAGRGGASKVLTAERGASVEQVLGAAVVRANPFLRGKTAGWLIDWAHRKMGGAAPPESRARLGDGFTEDPAEAVAVQDALDAAQARAAALAEAQRAEQGEADPFAEALDADPVPVAALEDLPPPNAAAELLPALRERVADGTRSLRDIAGLAAELGVPADEVRRGLTMLAQLGELRFVQRFADRQRVKNSRGRWRTRTPQEIAADNGGVWTGGFARKAVRGADDLFAFIARHGGLEPHGLGAAEVARRERDGTPVRGHDLRNVGGLANVLVPGHGPLLNPRGRGLDGMLELAHDAGFFGPTDVTPRPTESEFLTLIDDLSRRGEKLYLPEDAPGPRAGASEADEIADELTAEHAAEADELTAYWARYDRLSDAAHARYQVVLLGGDVEELEALMRAGTETLPPLEPGTHLTDDELAPYVGEFLNRKLEEALDEMRLEADDATYDPWLDPDGPEAGEAAIGGRGSETVARDPQGGAAAAADGGGAAARAGDGGSATERAAAEGRRLADTPAEERAAFLDPDNAAATAQADSLAHDARAALDRGEAVDPNIAAVARQENALRAEQPLRGERKTGEAQDPTLPEGLFGGEIEPPLFRLDAEGDGERSLRELLDDIDAEAADLKTIRDCL